MLRIIIGAGLLFTGCGSHPVLPHKSDIKLTRNDAPKNCENLGSIEGRSKKASSTPEEALEDLKSEAIKKGANFVKIETIGALSTSVRGTAYFCK